VAPHAQPAVPGGRGQSVTGTMGCVSWGTRGRGYQAYVGRDARAFGPEHGLSRSLRHRLRVLDVALPAPAFNHEGIGEARRRAVATSRATPGDVPVDWDDAGRDRPVIIRYAIGELGALAEGRALH